MMLNVGEEACEEKKKRSRRTGGFIRTCCYWYFGLTILRSSNRIACSTSSVQPVEVEARSRYSLRSAIVERQGGHLECSEHRFDSVPVYPNLGWV